MTYLVRNAGSNVQPSVARAWVIFKRAVAPKNASFPDGSLTVFRWLSFWNTDRSNVDQLNQLVAPAVVSGRRAGFRIENGLRQF